MKKLLPFLFIVAALADPEAKVTSQFTKFELQIDRINPDDDVKPDKVVNAKVTIIASQERLTWFRDDPTNQWQCLRSEQLPRVFINSDKTAAWTNQVELKSLFLSKAYEQAAIDAAARQAAIDAAKNNTNGIPHP